MNKERIKELAKQAEDVADKATNASNDDTGEWVHIWNEVYDEKFAELIVRECMKVAHAAAAAGAPIKESIAEHFGVK